MLTRAPASSVTGPFAPARCNSFCVDVLPLICYGAAEELELLAEYQTLRRLPQSNAIAFTVRTYVDPLRRLAQAPAATASEASGASVEAAGGQHHASRVLERLQVKGA